MAFLKNKKGMTLVEVLIVASITALLFIVAGTIYVTQNKLYGHENVKAYLQRDTLVNLYIITDQIKQGSEILESIIINERPFISTAKSIIIKTPSIDENKHFIEGSFDYIVFYLNPESENELKMIIKADPISSRTPNEKILNHNIKDINFEYNNENFENVNRVNINLSLGQEYHNQKYTFSLNTSTTIRNYIIE